MAKDDPTLYLPTVLEDINALLSDAVDLFAAGKAGEAVSLVKAARDAAREAIDDLEEYEEGGRKQWT